jgi:hypothetical protein
VSPEAEFIAAELPEIAKIIHNECWLEGERRGCAVDRYDPVVLERVAAIILGGVGAHLRQVHGRGVARG